MENDYKDIRKNNFDVDYAEPGGWGSCGNNFYEVRKKLDYV